MCGLNPFGQRYSVNGFLVTHRALHKSTLCFSLPTPFSLCALSLLHLRHSYTQASFIHTPPPLFPPFIPCLLIEPLNYDESAPCLGGFSHSSQLTCYIPVHFVSVCDRQSQTETVGGNAGCNASSFK